MTEHWRPIAGFDGYEVSDLGRVRSWKVRGPSKAGRRRKVPIIRRTDKMKRCGYEIVGLRDGGEPIKKLVHRLVLEAFVGACPLGMQACHNDGNPTNNRLSNLRWDTPAENGQDRIRHGTQVRGVRQGKAKLTPHLVREIRRRKQKERLTNLELARQYGVSDVQIGRVTNLQSWRHVD